MHGGNNTYHYGWREVDLIYTPRITRERGQTLNDDQNHVLYFYISVIFKQNVHTELTDSIIMLTLHCLTEGFRPLGVLFM